MEEAAKILGRVGNDRVYRYIKRRYVSGPENFDKYKLFLSKAIGTGSFGETISEPVYAGPGVGSTEAFLSIGSFSSQEELAATEKFLKTKFSRALLGVLKVTHDMTPGKLKYIPLQDFSESSDIDWSLTISEIDQQLYAKYGLSGDEIQFIETYVKEMN